MSALKALNKKINITDKLTRVIVLLKTENNNFKLNMASSIKRRRNF